IRDGYIECTIQVRVEEHDAKAQSLYCRGTQPRGVAPVPKDHLAAILKHGCGLVLKVGHQHRRPARTVNISDGDAHARHEAAVGHDARAAEIAKVFEDAMPLVVEYIRGTKIVRDINVDLPVIIQVGKPYREAPTGLC